MALTRNTWHTVVQGQTLADLEYAGRTVALCQPRLAKFAAMLAHPEFAEFFDQNFQTWDECQTSIMLLKMGTELRNLLAQSSGDEVSGHQLAAAMAHVMDRADTRQCMVQWLRDFLPPAPSTAPQARLEPAPPRPQ